MFTQKYMRVHIYVRYKVYFTKKIPFLNTIDESQKKEKPKKKFQGRDPTYNDRTTQIEKDEEKENEKEECIC